MHLRLVQSLFYVLCLTSSAYAASAIRPFRVVTYNVHWGEGLKGDAASFGRFLNEDPRLAPFDVLSVQEICGTDNAKQVRDMTALLQSYAPIYTHFVSSDVNDKEQCEKGQAIFSRHPIVNVGSILLPFVRQWRVMVWVDLKVNNKLVRIYDLHLDSRASDFFKTVPSRLKQVRFAINEFMNFRAANPGAVTIVAGDFNSWNHLVDFGTKEASILEMEKYFESSLAHFEVTQGPWQLDWIFSNGAFVWDSKVIREHRYSDHFPVYADFIF